MTKNRLEWAYNKYMEILGKYKDIKILRWQETTK